MKEKIVGGVIIIAVLLISIFFVTAFSNAKTIDKSSQKQASILTVSNDETEDSPETETDNEHEQEIKGTELDRASEVALAYIGEGKVTDSEIGDEEGYYEIEITLKNGKQVDVHLDKNFKVINVKYENGKDDN